MAIDDGIFAIDNIITYQYNLPFITTASSGCASIKVQLKRILFGRTPSTLCALMIDLTPFRPATMSSCRSGRPRASCSTEHSNDGAEGIQLYLGIKRRRKEQDEFECRLTKKTIKQRRWLFAVRRNSRCRSAMAQIVANKWEMVLKIGGL